MNPKIIIIGAGVSGIAAGTKLLESGFKNLIILEAENRIGGRVHTIPFASNVVDLGAQWCHGEKDNVVYELAKNHNLLDSATTKYDQFLFIRSNGEHIKEADGDKLMGLAISVVEDFKTEIETYDGSLGAFIVTKYKEALKTPDYSDVDPILANQFLDFFHKYENSIEASDTWFETSGQGYLHYWDCEGDRLLNWKDRGYGTIFDLLMNKLPDPSKAIPIENYIQFNKFVTKINWQQETDNSVSVTCTDGTIYDADHVIVTSSLGVLRENYKEMFTPSLPSLKRNAIEGLTLGTVDKIFLEFDKPFWPKDWQGFSLLWNKTDLDELRRSQQNNGWLEDVFGFYVVDYQPNILCGWISGEKARRMERDTEENVRNGAMFLIRKFLNKWTIPEPINMKRSTWYSNPNFRGSYSFRSTMSDLLNTTAADLAKPLTNTLGVPIVQFAGEATHSHYYSTVHGAVESGWREAKRLLDQYKKQTNRENVLILGAGLAGLGAALTLKEAGYRIKILEAQSKCGGRVNSVLMKKISITKDNEDKYDYQNDQNSCNLIDAGAQWLHGKNNNLYKVAEANHLLINDISEEGLGVYLTNNGKIIDDYFVKWIDFKVGQILEECEKFVHTDLQDNLRKLSVETFLTNKFNTLLKEIDDPKKKDDALLLLDWHLRFQIIDNACINFSEVSAKDWGKYSFNGESCQAHINFRNGFEEIFDVLLAKFDPEEYKLNTEVVEIDWTTNAFVTVKCKNNEIFQANHVIVTFSLGVLKDNMSRLFKPQLPIGFQDIIKTTGYGTINKIFLKFKTAWWENPDGIQLIWTTDENINHWTRAISGFDVMSPGPANTLIGWIGGDGAIEMEKLTDEIIVKDCIAMLSQFTEKIVPLPEYYYCTRWNSNENIKGAYSYTSVNRCLLNAKISLSDPISLQMDKLGKNQLELECPRLLLAGEACHEQYFSTAHGAFASGIDQANKIIDHYKRKKLNLRF